MADRKNATFSVDIKTLEEFKKVAEQTRIPQSRLVDEALAHIVKKYKKEGK